MHLIAFAMVILAGAVVFTKNDEFGSWLIFVGAVLSVMELFRSGFVKEVFDLGKCENPPKPPTEEPPHPD